MKRYNFLGIILSLALLFSLSSCEKKDEGTAPTVKIKIGGSERTNMLVSKDAAVTISVEVSSAANLEKIEVFTREGRELPNMLEKLLAQVNDITGKEFSKSYDFTVTDDLSFSVYAVDADGNNSSRQVDIRIDVKKYEALTVSDGTANGISKTFCDTQNGLVIHQKILNTNKNVDFGFFYDQTKPAIGAALVSLNEYHKTGIYPAVSGAGTMVFRKITDLSYATAADLKSKFDAGTPIAATEGFNSIAPALADGDMLAFKNVRGNYGMIEIVKITVGDDPADGTQNASINIFVEQK